MPINVGAVEVVLSGRDSTLSPVLIAAAQRVVDLQAQLKTLGDASTQEFAKVSAALSAATKSFESLNVLMGQGTTSAATLAAASRDLSKNGIYGVEQAAIGASGAVKTLKEDTEATGQTFAQVEGMAQRMIERFVILAAIRIGFNFVESIFGDADKIVNLNQQLDITMGKLQEIRYVADTTGVGFDKAAGYIDTFMKKINEGSMNTSEVMRSIGIDMGDFLNRSKDAQWEIIVQHLAGIGDAAKRHAAEVKLFGTDGIDPLIESFEKLGPAASKASDEQEKALSNTLRYYREFGNDAKNEITQVFLAWQDLVAHFAAPAFGGQVNGPVTMSQWLKLGVNALFPGAVDLGVVPEGLKPSAKPATKDPYEGYGHWLPDGTYVPPTNSSINLQPTMEQAGFNPNAKSPQQRAKEYIDSIRAESGENMPLTSWQRADLDYLREHNRLTEASADKIFINRTQYEEYVKSHQHDASMLASLAQWNNLLDQANSIYANGQLTNYTAAQWQAIIGSAPASVQSLLQGASADTLNEATSLLAGRMAPEGVAKLTGLTVEGVKAVTDSLRELVSQEKEMGRAIDEIQRKNITPIQLLGFNPATGLSQLPQDTVFGSHPFTIQNPPQPGQAKGDGTPLGLMGSDALIANAQARMRAAEYTIADEFAGTFAAIPRILEDGLLGSTQSIDQIMGKIAAKVGQDFFKDFALTVDNNLKNKLPEMAGVWGDIIGIGITNGLGIALKGGSFKSQVSGSMMSGVGTAFESYFTNYMTLGSSIAAGVATFGISTAIELAGMGLRELFKDHMPDDLARDAGVKFGQAWSDSLIKTIQSRANEMVPESLRTPPNTLPNGQPITGRMAYVIPQPDNKRGEQAAEILSLPDIIKDSPVTAENLKMYEQRLHDLFSMIQMNKVTVQEATTVLDDTFNQIIKVATAPDGRIDNAMADIIALDAAMGTHSKAIADWKKAQGSDIIAGFSAAVKADLPTEVWDQLKKAVDDAQKAVDDFKAKNPDKLVPKDLLAALATAQGAQGAAKTEAIGRGAIGDLSAQAVGSYAAAVATGVSPTDAIKQESDALTELEKAYKDLGIEVTDTALKELFMRNDLAKAAPTLMAGIDGITKAMIGLDNVGGETAEMFQHQENTAVDMYTRLQSEVAKLGGGTKEALIPMQQFLHEALIEAQRLGVPLDQTIQNMIKDSKELGIWQDDYQSGVTAQEKATQDLIKAIKDLINALRDIPKDVTSTIHVRQDNGADGANGGTAGQSLPPGPNSPAGPGSDLHPGKVIFDAHASGGIVRDNAIPGFSRGGTTDTQLIWATPGEGIITKSAMANVGVAGLAAINSGSGLADIIISAIRNMPRPILHNQTYIGGKLVKDTVIDELENNPTRRDSLVFKQVIR